MAAPRDDLLSARSDAAVPEAPALSEAPAFAEPTPPPSGAEREPSKRIRRRSVVGWPSIRALAAIVVVAMVGGVLSGIAAGPLLLKSGDLGGSQSGGSSAASNEPEPTAQPGADPVTQAAGIVDITAYRGSLPGSPEGPTGPESEPTSQPVPASQPFVVVAPVLTYHRIDPLAPADEYVVRPTLFDAHLRALWIRGWRTITAHDLGILLATRVAPAPRTFVITIDDGWEDGLTSALPILERYGDVATFYVVPGLIGTERYMSWDQVRTLHAHGMEIGNHTRDHPHLTQLSAAAKAAQIDGAQALITSELGAEPDTFAYPFGEFDDATVQAASDGAFLVAFTTRTGTTASWATRLTIPRIHVGAGMTVTQLLQAMGAGR